MSFSGKFEKKIKSSNLSKSFDSKIEKVRSKDKIIPKIIVSDFLRSKFFGRSFLWVLWPNFQLLFILAKVFSIYYSKKFNFFQSFYFQSLT